MTSAERISCKYLARYRNGFDTATINEGTPAEEMAVYAPDSIIRVEPVDTSMRQFFHLWWNWSEDIKISIDTIQYSV